MASFVTFGETMIQYNAGYMGPYDLSGSHMEDVAGAESNVAVNLRTLTDNKIETLWISRLGDDEPGESIHAQLSLKTEVKAPLISKEFTGISYLNHYTDGRHIKTYKRSGSAASKLTFDDIEPHLAGADILHVTGITPALSESCADAVVRSVKACRHLGIPVSFDVNYRNQLWQPKEARHFLNKILPFVTILKLGYDEARTICGNELTANEYAVKFHRGPVDVVIITTESDGAIMFDGVEVSQAEGISVNAVDPVGAGDAFVAGFLGGIYLQLGDTEDLFSLDNQEKSFAFRKSLEIANICGALTCTRKGDTSAMPNASEVLQYVHFKMK